MGRGGHFAGDFVSFDGRTLRLELSFGRPRFTMLGGERPPGPVVDIHDRRRADRVPGRGPARAPRVSRAPMQRDTARTMSEENVEVVRKAIDYEYHGVGG